MGPDGQHAANNENGRLGTLQVCCDCRYRRWFVGFRELPPSHHRRQRQHPRQHPRPDAPAHETWHPDQQFFLEPEASLLLLPCKLAPDSESFLSIVRTEGGVPCT